MTDTTTVLRQVLDVLEIARDLHCLPGPVTTLVYQAIRSIQAELAHPAVSVDTLDHMPYQGRPSRPEERIRTSEPVCPVCQQTPTWEHDRRVGEWEGRCVRCGIDGPVGLTLKDAQMRWAEWHSKSPAAPAPNPWREAIDAELVCLHLGTVDSFLDAKAALDALIDWHVATALDPEVSSDARALIDRGAAAPVPAVQSAARAIAAEQSYDTGLWFFASTVSEAHLQAALRRLTAAVEREAP